MEEAEKLLRTAAGFGQAGHYQLEAAIQSIHAVRAKTGRIDWQEIALLYEGLVRLAPNVGASVGRAVALAQAGNPSGGLRACLEIALWVAQATGLCRPATRRTERTRHSHPMRTPKC